MSRIPDPFPTADTPPKWRGKRIWWTLLLLLPAAFTFTAAHRSADAIPCRALEIEVDQIEGMFFVDAPSLHSMVTEQFQLMDHPMSSLPLNDIRAAILGQHGVADCQLEPTLGGSLRIVVQQQRPIARIWLPDSALYLDDRGNTLPLSNRYSAEVPVVHAPDIQAAMLAMPLLLKMDTSPYWDAFIDQIEVGTDGMLSFRPRVADLVVQLGVNPADALDTRLERLNTFYTELIRRGDLRQYRTISLQFDGQLVAAK